MYYYAEDVPGMGQDLPKGASEKEPQDTFGEDPMGANNLPEGYQVWQGVQELNGRAGLLLKEAAFLRLEAKRLEQLLTNHLGDQLTEADQQPPKAWEAESPSYIPVAMPDSPDIRRVRRPTPTRPPPTRMADGNLICKYCGERYRLWWVHRLISGFVCGTTDH